MRAALWLKKSFKDLQGLWNNCESISRRAERRRRELMEEKEISLICLVIPDSIPIPGAESRLASENSAAAALLHAAHCVRASFISRSPLLSYPQPRQSIP